MAAEFNVDPGEMRERITLREPVLTKDAVGQDVISWNDITVWAKHTPLNARDREVVAAGQKVAEQSARFIIRRRTEVSPTWRLIWAGVEYNIISTTQPNRSWTDVLCIRGLP